jgi:Zn-dependent M28 family amino/carboxypeptidase
MLRLILPLLIILVILKLTTFGWQELFFAPSKYPPCNKELISRLKAHVVKLSGDIGERSVFEYTGLTETANYITEQFEGLGLEVEAQEYLLNRRPVKNLIAKKAGAEKPEEVIILGAHYDTCFNPGANDNASAIAGLLELSRLLAQHEYRRTIKFIAFVNEEPPFFKTEDMGSFVYARQAKERDENIKAVLILEMIGFYCDRPFSQRYPLFIGPFYPNRANFIAVVGNFHNRQLVKNVKDNFKKHSQFPIRSAVLFDFVPGVDFSDHWSFWQMGFPAVMITDTAFYRYAHYHSSSDTFEKLDYQKMSAVVQGLQAVLSELAR